MQLIFRIALLLAWTVFWVHVWNAVGPAHLDPSLATSDGQWFVSLILFILTWAFLAGPILWRRGHAS